MRATILSTGTELTTGQTVDTNSAWLSARLTALGVSVTRHVTVGDELDVLASTLGKGLDSSDLVILTGGLGPTPDDVTREALGKALAQPLVEDEKALAEITRFFARRQRAMPDSNRLQALRPTGCTSITNPLGTAPGIRFEGPRVLAFALPGVPAEMKAMFEASVVPEIQKRMPGGAGHVIVLRSYGLGEAQVGEALADLMRPGRNPAVGTTASHAVIGIRIVSTGRDAETTRRMAEQDADVVRERLGTAIFGEGDDTLPVSLARLLLQHKLTVATAESCTGGLLAKTLTDVPGASGYFRQGYVTYADDAKSNLLGLSAELIAQQGAVSEAVARELAVRCREQAAVDFALSTTGIAGPRGGQPPDKPIGLVFVGLAGPRGASVKRLLLGETLSRDEIRDRACKTALNVLRLQLLA